MRAMAPSEGPDEMQHNVSFHSSLAKEIQYYSETITPPYIYNGPFQVVLDLVQACC